MVNVTLMQFQKNINNFDNKSLYRKPQTARLSVNSPLAPKQMNTPDCIKKRLFSKINLYLILMVYLFSATYLSNQVLSEGNLAAPDIISKIVLLLLVILVASPAFAIGSLIMKLRLQHLIETQDIYEFIMPTKGSIGNPDLSIYMGSKTKTIWRIFIGVLIISLVIVFAFSIGNETL